MARQPKFTAWEDFVTWCQQRGLTAVPANPWTLAAYIRWCEPRQTPRAIAKAVREISNLHESKTRRRIDRDPLVQRTMEMIEKRHRAAKEKPKLDLFDDPNAAAPIKTPASKRKPKTTTKAKTKAEDAAKPSRARQGLSTTPRLVSRRRLSR